MPTRGKVFQKNRFSESLLLWFFIAQAYSHEPYFRQVLKINLDGFLNFSRADSSLIFRYIFCPRRARRTRKWRNTKFRLRRWRIPQPEWRDTPPTISRKATEIIEPQRAKASCLFELERGEPETGSRSPPLTVPTRPCHTYRVRILPKVEDLSWKLHTSTAKSRRLNNLCNSAWNQLYEKKAVVRQCSLAYLGKRLHATCICMKPFSNDLFLG